MPVKVIIEDDEIVYVETVQDLVELMAVLEDKEDDEPKQYH